MNLARAYINANLRAFDAIRDATTATPRRRITTAASLIPIGAILATADPHPLVPLGVFTTAALAILAMPLIDRWDQARHRRAAARLIHLAAQLDATGLHESASQLRTLADLHVRAIAGR
jgi:hypothetical protein